MFCHASFHVAILRTEESFEHMSLLDKKNPKATAGTVLRHALICGFVGACLFFLFFKTSYREVWPVALPIWVLLCAGVGALLEWQVRNG